MRNLNNIDIITINCTDSQAGLMSIKHCQKFFNFGKAMLFTNEDIFDENVEVIKINKLNSVDEYNNYVLNLNKYLKNDFVLVIQDDGFIVNHNLWDDKFLEYDYIGSPWPSVNDTNWINLQNKNLQPYLLENLKNNRIGNGGFSLRSKKFLEYSSQFNNCEGIGEDAFLNIVKYKNAVDFGIKYPSIDLALKFSHEIPFINSENNISSRNYEFFDINQHFGFHGYNFSNSNQLINLKINEK